MRYYGYWQTCDNHYSFFKKKNKQTNKKTPIKKACKQDNTGAYVCDDTDTYDVTIMHQTQWNVNAVVTDLSQIPCDYSTYAACVLYFNLQYICLFVLVFFFWCESAY